MRQTPLSPKRDTPSPFPFVAMVAQQEMQLGLLLAATDPLIGGVLILGDRGTASHRRACTGGRASPHRGGRGLPIPVPTECARGLCPSCTGGAGTTKSKPRAERITVPVVDLPLGATEDRILGALNLERLMASGEKVFEPGLLAKANRGFLVYR